MAGNWNELLSKSTLSRVVGLIVRLSHRVDRGVLERFPNLDFVISATTGHDHLDLPEMQKRGVRLISLRGHDAFLNNIPSTSEHTWALLMALVRNIPSADRHVMNGEWNRDLFRGHQLKDKTIGLIGLGRVGRKLATYATAFDLKVCYYDPYVEETKYLRYEVLSELIKNSDIVSIHVHLSPETFHLINQKNLIQAKPGAFLVNTSRGDVWDEKAIVDRLYSGALGGVATDVLSTELDDINKSLLLEARKEGFNVVITPHIGGATWEAMWACEEYVASLI